jgi:hypothetical protein
MNKTQDRAYSYYGDVASGFLMEGTMRARYQRGRRMSALRAEIREAALAWLGGNEAAGRKRAQLLAQLREIEKENDDA